MAKKTLKKKVQAKAQPSKLAAPVMESAREIWLAGLGAFSVAQQESGKIIEQGNKLFDRLVAEGSKLEKNTRKAAEAQVSDVRSKVTGMKGEVESRVDAVRQQAQDNWDKLENVFEDRVARVLGRLGVPTADEVRNLTRQVEALNRKVADAARTPKASGRKAAAFHLLPQDEGWVIRAEGSEADISVHPTKGEALDAGREFAQKNEPSRLVVHKQDGTIQTSYSYGDA